MTCSYIRIKNINLYLFLKAVVIILGISLFILLLFHRSSIILFSKEISAVINNTPPQTIQLPYPEILQHLQAHNPNLPTDYEFHPAPSKRGLPDYRNPDMHTMGQYIYHLLKEKKNGFFIESGAFDGLWISNTFWLEKMQNWTGLLVEVDPRENAVLKKRNRRAWVADVCLSTEIYPISLNFTLLTHGQTLVPNPVREAHEGRKRHGIIHEAKCYPLHMLLDAIDVKEVDYWSLDIEGLDLAVLKTVPWHRIKIKVISVEGLTEKASRSIGKYLENVGYKNITRLVSHPEFLQDDVYVLQTQ